MASALSIHALIAAIPATATGFLKTGKTDPDEKGLQEVVEGAPSDQKMNAYRDWLAAHARIKTKHLDEFYTHYAYPTA